MAYSVPEALSRSLPYDETSQSPEDHDPRAKGRMRRPRRHADGPGWARAKTILKAALASRYPGARCEIGRVSRFGEGLSRDAFAASVELVPDPDELSGPFAVLLPARDAVPGVDARTRREAQLLQRLSDLDLPIRVPFVLGAWPDAGHLALLREWLDGIPLDLRAGRQGGVRPWEVVGQVAAVIHSLDVRPLADLVPGSDTRRAHAEGRLPDREEADPPEVAEALAWAGEHLPPADPSVLVHGDLLGQNILLDPGEPFGVIDWEYAQRGDPAYDLAIVTRGARKPFQTADGMQLLLEAYARHGGRAVEAPHVHVHELVMQVAQYRASLLPSGGEPPDQALARLRNLLRRLGA